METINFIETGRKEVGLVGYFPLQLGLSAMVVLLLFASCGNKEKEKKNEPNKGQAAKVAMKSPMITPMTMKKTPVDMKTVAMKAVDKITPMTAPAKLTPPEKPASASTTPKNEAALPIPKGSEIPHAQCNLTYRSGSDLFRENKFEQAIAKFTKYITGQCFDRITASTDLWLTERAFLSACQIPTKKHMNAFKALRAKACKKYGDDKPCDKPPECPGKRVDRAKCNELYSSGSSATKQKDHKLALTKFSAFAKEGCFGKLTKTTDMWASYRGILAARALSKPEEPFLGELKKVCKKKRKAWACKQIFKRK